MTFQKGYIPWNKNKKQQYNSGEKHYRWKGDDVSYDAIHDWVEKKKGKASFCSFNPEHTAKNFNWANISGSYLRDIDDYASLCPICHNQYDAIRRGYFTPRGRKIAYGK
jgi:hypothetical protein